MKTEYSIEDIMQMFGYRIQDAIRTNSLGESGLDEDTMRNKLKWWKFWNRDIKKAYKCYNGKTFDNWTILLDENKKFRNAELHDWMENNPR